MPSIIRRLSLGSCAGAALLALAAPVAAQAQTQAVTFDIPAQDLAAALRAFARQSGQQVIFDGAAARGKTSQAVKGGYPVEQGLDVLLRGSGLSVKRGARGVLMVGETASPQAEAAAANAEPAQVEELLVTGSRIRGAPPASPVIQVTAEQMRQGGQPDLGEVVRNLPQNFGGGSNPGLGFRNGSIGGNFGGASTLNLRGIGADATLTLLNGHRLSTNANTGVDITSVPIAALERIEILTDGASALYGSDAVGGVANIITRRSYRGLTVQGLYGGSTEGGYTLSQLSAVGGSEWTGGGFVVAASTQRNTLLAAGKRSFTSLMNPDATLFPDQDRRNLFLSASQTMGDQVHLRLDGLYSRNVAVSQAPSTLNLPYTTSGRESRSVTQSYSLTPSITVDLSKSWTLDAFASLARDRYKSVTHLYAAVSPPDNRVCYCNSSSVVEVSLEGGLLRLPAGPMRLAIGGGYRQEGGALLQSDATLTSYTDKQKIGYGFGELAIPLVSPAQGISFVRALSVSAALRYEDYESTGSIATPKVGIIYDLNEDFTFKGSWGKSFKAAIFNQRDARTAVSLVTVSGYGTLYPTGATFLSVSGGNNALEPERANSLTFTGEFHPSAMPGLRLSAGYYRIHYKNRVVQPFASTAGVLTNPLYASFVTKSPTAAQQAATIARASLGLTISTPITYDPNRVVAIVDRSFTNATAQHIDGFDLAGSYSFDLNGGDGLALSASATYLDIRQQLIPTTPMVNLAGNFYQPRHFRGRAGITWTHGDLSVSSFVNHTGAARFRQVTPIQDVKAMTTLDVTARWRAPAPFGADVGLNLINAFDAKPTVVPPTISGEITYDATVYSALGRTLTVSLSRKF